MIRKAPFSFYTLKLADDKEGPILFPSNLQMSTKKWCMILLTRWECFYFFSQISQWTAASWGSFRELYGEESTFAKVTNHSTWEAGVSHTPADVGTWSNCGIYIHRYCWCLKLSAVRQTCCWNFRICWIHSYIEWGVLYYLVCRRSEFHSQTPRGGAGNWATL